jgi:hypothetical protein
MNIFRAFIRALRDERIRAKRKWAYRDRIVKSAPKADPRDWQRHFRDSVSN